MCYNFIFFEHRTFMDKFVGHHPTKWQSTDYLSGISTPVTETQMYNTLVR